MNPYEQDEHRESEEREQEHEYERADMERDDKEPKLEYDLEKHGFSMECEEDEEIGDCCYTIYRTFSDHVLSMKCSIYSTGFMKDKQKAKSQAINFLNEFISKIQSHE